MFLSDCIEWDDNPAANLTEKPGGYNSYESWCYREVVTPTAAYKVNDQLSVAFGVSLGRSEAEHEYQNYALTTGDGFSLPMALGPVNVEEEMDAIPLTSLGRMRTRRPTPWALVWI
jgi:long-chain fatty acid transport protein